MKVPEMSPHEEYGRWDHMTGPSLRPLPKPCWDCAMVCEFYLEIAEDLMKEPVEMQSEIASRWSCHNAPQQACAGIAEFLNKGGKR